MMSVMRDILSLVLYFGFCIFLMANNERNQKHFADARKRKIAWRMYIILWIVALWIGFYHFTFCRLFLVPNLIMLGLYFQDLTWRNKERQDLETKLAFLQMMAEQEKVTLPTDVALYIASNIRSNVPENLKGAMTRLAAHSSLTESEITLPYARQVLKKFIDSQAPMPKSKHLWPSRNTKTTN